MRWGAIGDCIQATVVFRPLKQEGYHVTFHTGQRGLEVIKNNPFVDETILHKERTIPGDELREIWGDLQRRYDRFINLSGTVEVALLKTDKDPEYYWTREDRHRVCNKNYSDHTLEWAGFPNIKGRNPELYISPDEDRMMKSFMRKFRGKFVILWAMSGSSLHKAYPWAEFVANEILKRHKDVHFITVGDSFTRLIEWENRHTTNLSAEIPIRRSIIMPKYVDLVVGPETGVLNAASCFDTPKIVFLSHSTVENLTKYWKNCISLHAPEEIKCYPCHKLTYDWSECPQTQIMKTAACTTNITPASVIKAIEQFYSKWRKG